MATDFIVESGSRKYEVLFAKESSEIIAQLAAIKNTITIVDQHIERLYPELIAKVREFSPVYSIEASEENKTLTGAEAVLQILQKHNATKSTTVVAFGGGIVQDIVSFAAHIYYRGLNFVFVPTTLLAMCDSCIGGKCGLNYHGYKNQLGAFHPPEKVLIWNGFVDTLPEDAIYSGYGEIFKLMLIGNTEMYHALKAVVAREGFKNSSVLSHIHQGLVIKKKFIEEDEFDNGVRRILNYGHTFGHALELATNYDVPHGIAVARGIDIANYIAWQKGFLSEKLYLDVHEFIESNFHCGMTPEISAESLLAHAQKDKKVANGKLNMIFMEEIGKFSIEPVLLDRQMNDIVHGYIKGNPSLYRV